MPWESRASRLLVSLALSLLGLSNSPGDARGSSAWQHPICKRAYEFWSSERSSCWPCTRCAPQITISPCAVYKDAICGPLSALEFDWSFLSTRKLPETEPNEPTGRRRLEAVTSKMIWRLPSADVEISREDEDLEVGGGKDEPVTEAEEASTPRQTIKRHHDPRERRKWLSEDGVEWDWQTGALVLAVCACIIFFLVAGCSALVYARQWRRMKKNFEPAGLEEISARLNYMVKAELAELVAGGAPMNPGDPETRCQYLEKLLDRKRETPAMVDWPEEGGNLYIEEGHTTPRSKRSQIARIHRNIETILSHKPTTAIRN